MRRIAIDDVDSDPDDEALHADRRALADPLGTDHLAITRYVLEPGERFSGSVHAHTDQEEVFVVLEGEATFELGAAVGDEATERVDEVTVAEGEVVRFAPGEFQSGRNAGDDRVVALALGAPRDSKDVRIARIPGLDDGNIACPDCDCDHMRLSRTDETDFECPDCEATLVLEE
ncbi:Cupin 2 conserved barrel domain protein [Haloterrigena turkmenica DSM 5511]|uniref:Cupin 2 conserved barrel domain protein n=1 Tax=Haloterrigena turkmenica (strain ATCC 51198 / DSM 5511 / JCM 9101 / NCIMB 13204 / VKM B-1734 / 4k) TaxID=543526 RepID=D2RQ85_HALTV|nr:cupin domain-containing protein [Haloterrigena turkmenica]ADB62262.1 Cupin 2 conserved barrel domain protein [Haloterrigena turkmenica DSM 5511]